MDEYPEIEFGSVDVKEVEKIGKKTICFVIKLFKFIVQFLNYIALRNFVFYVTCFYKKV